MTLFPRITCLEVVNTSEFMQYWGFKSRCLEAYAIRGTCVPGSLLGVDY